MRSERKDRTSTGSSIDTASRLGTLAVTVNAKTCLNHRYKYFPPPSKPLFLSFTSLCQCKYTLTLSLHAIANNLLVA
jgi:hypothetical protein